MEYKYVCPKCGRIEYFKTQKTVDRKSANKELCRVCKEKKKNLQADYTRICPKCGKEIHYKYKSDYKKAILKNSLCKHCAVSKSSIFQKGHTLNEQWTIRENSLNKLIEDKSLQTFYWIGFILADGSFYNDRFEFGLKQDDIMVLQEFAKYINYKGTIKHRDSTSSNRLYFNNKPSIENFMKEYGISYNKTYNPCNFDTFNKYSKNQILALLIGIIDGDGCIESNGSKYSNSIIITSHINWKSFYEDLFKFIGFDFHYRINKNNPNVSSIGIYKREYCLLLKDFIENNNLFNLNRKWEKILRMPKEKE